MKNKKKLLAFIPALALSVTLTSCWGGIGLIIDDGKDIILNTGNKDYQITTKLLSTSIPQYSDAYGALQPNTSLEVSMGSHVKTNKLTLSDGIRYFVIDDKSNKTFEMGDPLPQGSYTLRTVYNHRIYGRLKDEQKFNVVPVVEDANNDSPGYKKVSLKGNTLLERQSLGALGGGLLPSVGNPYMLIIPVTFRDTSISKRWTNKDLQLLNQCYFGEGMVDQGGWYSLKEYYQISSYGKLNFTGRVTPPFRSSMTEREFQRKNLSSKTSLTAHRDLIREILRTCTNIWNIDLRDCDSDKDGWMDGIELIYKSDSTEKTESQTWWNYTAVADNNLQPAAPGQLPNPHYFFFSQFKQIDNGYYKTKYNEPLPDAHTIVHETGHMMGAQDYYSYDRTKDNGYTEGALGGNDMMDFNVGDHNPYTKSLYGWVNPYVVDGSRNQFEITLNNFAESGEYILLRNTSDSKQKWNNTPFDEYLTLSYYAPIGVNYPDCFGYKEYTQSGRFYGHGGSYESPGLQVLHVDSRLVNKLVGYGDYDGRYLYLDTYVDKGEVAYYTIDGVKYRLAPSKIGQSNTESYNVQALQDYNKITSNNKRLISAISANCEEDVYSNAKFTTQFGVQNNIFGTETGGASNDFSMYKYGKYFRVNQFAFNDGSKLNWDFRIVKQDAKSCTIQFTKLF